MTDLTQYLDVAYFYNIYLETHSNSLIDVYGSNSSDGAFVGIYAPNKTYGTPNQQFRLVISPKEGVQIISGLASDKVLSLNPAKNEIILKKRDNKDQKQFFNLIHHQNNQYIISPLAIKDGYLAVANDGKNLIAKTGSSSQATLLRFEKTNKKVSIPFQPKLDTPYRITLANDFHKELFVDLYEREPRNQYRMKIYDNPDPRAPGNKPNWSFYAIDGADYPGIKYKSVKQGIGNGNQVTSDNPFNDKVTNTFILTDVGGDRIKLESPNGKMSVKHLAMDPADGLIKEVHFSQHKEYALFRLFENDELERAPDPVVTRPRSNDPVSLFEGTYTVPVTKSVLHFKVNKLVCINTQDDGYDEIKISIEKDGQSFSKPENGYHRMNEESNFEEWEINFETTFVETLKLSVHDIDNSDQELIGTLDLSRDSFQGVHQEEMNGPNDSKYIISYILFDGDIKDVPILTCIYFDHNFVRNEIKPAALSGGLAIEDLLEKQNAELEAIRKAILDNEYRLEKIETVAGDYAISLGLSAVPLIVMGTANYLLVAGVAVGAGVALAKATAATAGVALAVTAVASAVVLPIYFAGTEGTLFVEVVNNTGEDLIIDSYEMSSGKKMSGPIKGDIIPGRKEGLCAVNFITFDKKWGLTGIVGKIKFKPTLNMPGGMTLDFSVPYSGDNTVSVDIPNHAGKSTSTGLTADNGQTKAYCNISSDEGWFPKVILYVEKI